MPIDKIRLVLLDVDGVLTDGSIWLDKDGEEIKQFHVRDGLAIKMLQQKGIEVGIITGRSSSALEHRLRGLNVEIVYQNVGDKLAVYERILAAKGVGDSEVCYMGDDLPDIPVLHRVGLPSAPCNAVAEVRQISRFLSTVGGGQGAVRELADYILNKGKPMDKRYVFTKDAPAPIGPYSQAVVAGNLMFLSGQIAIDPATGEVIRKDFACQCRQVMENIKSVLEAGGSSLRNLVKVNVFLKDMNNFVEFNDIYAEYIQESKPARACVEVSRLPKDVDIEVEAVAIVR